MKKLKKIISLCQSKIVFWGVLILIGVILLIPYGAHLDQQSEQSILYSNIVAYSEKLGIAVPFSNQLKAEGVISITDSIEKDHGMSVFYPITWIHALNSKSVYIGNVVWHLYIFAFSILGLFCLYIPFESYFGAGTAKIAILFLYLTPRIFAEMHYNNKDIVLMALACIVYYFGWKLEKETTFSNAILFGIAGAFITNTKIVGFYIWGVIGIWVIIEKIIKKQVNIRLFYKVIVCWTIMVLVFALLTPATWGGLRSYIVYVWENAKNFRWNDYILFNGKMYNKTTTGIPRKYLPVIFFLTTPVGIITLSFIGGIALLGYIFRRKFELKVRFVFAIIICGLVPFAYAALTGATVYNGWRHFYFVYPSVIALLTLALDVFLRGYSKRLTVLTSATVIAYLCFIFVEDIIGHPYQYSYYNEIARYYVEDKYEIDYWDMSFKQLLESIAQKDSAEAIKIAAIDNPSKWGIEAQLLAIRGKNRGRMEIVDNWESADYVIVNTTYAVMYCPNEYQMLQEEKELFTEAKAYSNVLSRVYKLKE